VSSKRLHGLRQPPDRNRAQGRHLKEALGEPQRLGGQPDRPRRSELLHPRREVRRLADGRVVHAQVTSDRPDDDLAGVEPHADLHLQAVRSPQLVGVSPDRILHPQRGVTRADGVVLVGDRGAEQRHDAVAHHLVDGALVAMSRLHHPLEHRVEHPAGLLGIAVGQELHGALEVGEENRDLLALAFQDRARCEDLLGEVPRGVRLRRREARRAQGRCADRLSAL